MQITKSHLRSASSRRMHRQTITYGTKSKVIQVTQLVLRHRGAVSKCCRPDTASGIHSRSRLNQADAVSPTNLVNYANAILFDSVWGNLHEPFCEVGWWRGARSSRHYVPGSSSALAQNCGATTQTGATINNIGTLAIPPSSASASISAAIGNVNTVFLNQQGSAFVSAPANARPRSAGRRRLGPRRGGEVNLKSRRPARRYRVQSGGLSLPRRRRAPIRNSRASPASSSAPTLPA